MHAGIPVAPVMTNFDFIKSTTVNFSWSSSSNSTCFSHYSVNVTSIGYTISTNNTNLTLPIPSLNDTEYSISVAAVDTGGRYVNPHNITKFVLNGKFE